MNNPEKKEVEEFARKLLESDELKYLNPRRDKKQPHGIIRFEEGYMYAVEQITNKIKQLLQ